MARKPYEHSAYWYAYHYGWTYSEAETCTGRYLDFHSFYPREGIRESGERHAKGHFARHDFAPLLDATFNPLIFGVCIAMDIGIAMRDVVGKMTDAAERERTKRELMRSLRIVRRPFYYARETQRRRELAAARRKVSRRTTTAPMPTPEDVLAAWKARKESREAMIRLGGMLHDLECYVDNCLKFDDSGDVVGRNGGIRGWLRENLPELSPKYKTLMRYKALAVRFRQAAGAKDPTPASSLVEKPLPAALAAMLADSAPVFSHFFSELEHMLSPDAVFLDAPRPPKRE